MSEQQTHMMICNYLRTAHPQVMFHTDYAAGLKLSMGQAMRNRKLQSGSGWPDLFLPEPRGHYNGLFLEIKTEGTRVFLKNGKISSDPHLQVQAAVLEALGKRGYSALFAVGFDEARRIIDEYLAMLAIHHTDVQVVDVASLSREYGHGTYGR